MTPAQQVTQAFKAAHACGFKPHQITPTGEGFELRKSGKPVLLLTHQAAHEFAQEMAEASL
ncbi:hypothetical protein LJR164_001592 [Phenylobacterium sp. LjRoot164]|uniref:hypothetical protein n=1 Tax=unclassified Phenylobacterium TaxID=2640670 RepID=UPI003ED06495